MKSGSVGIRVKVPNLRWNQEGGKIVTVLIADDHPLFRDALRQVVAEAMPDAHIVEAQNLTDAKTSLSSCDELDLILLDLNMPGVNGMSGLVDLRDMTPTTPIVVVSASEEVNIIERAMVCGASGYIPKSLPKHVMVAAIGEIMAGNVFLPQMDGNRQPPPPSDVPEAVKRAATLTRKQRLVLSLIAQGKSNKIIAYELDVTDTTVKAHVTAILRKLKVTSRTQAAIVAREIEQFE